MILRQHGRSMHSFRTRHKGVVAVETSFLFLVDRNNGNWLVKYEVKANDERDTVGGQQTTVNTIYTRFRLLGVYSEIFLSLPSLSLSLFLLFLSFFYFVVCIASAPPLARQSTAATRLTGNRVEEFSRKSCVCKLRALSLTILDEETRTNDFFFCHLD